MLKLSIITINRNNAAGLQKTIESVLSQTYTDFEYIVIDGASTDESVSILKEYAVATLPCGEGLVGGRFYWISEPDKGVYNAMNKGILKAKGEYLLFLNSGDVLLNENVLSQVFSYAVNTDIIAGNIIRGGKEIKSPDRLTIRNLLISSLSHQSEFFKKDLFEAIGLYKECYKFLSDYDFNLHCAIQQVTYTHLDISIVDYDDKGMSSSPENGKMMFNEGEKIILSYISPAVYDDYKEMLNKKREIHPSVRWLLNNNTAFKMLKAIYKLVGNKNRTMYE